ncbi:MAG: inositol monophosphatase [Chloroflexi bacterium]|nr:inositol monophosphatase [Chloroflexota bacterium]
MATEAARCAGSVIIQRFHTQKEVRYKGRGNLVTDVDLAAEKAALQVLTREYPDFCILSEESEPVTTGSPYTWVLDPLDGTRNFMSGLPVYACSIGVLHQGAPIAGAVFLPWPNAGAGVVLHAHKGGGAFKDGERITVATFTEPQSNAIVGLPASFGAGYRFQKAMWGKTGEPRVTGSIAYELAMTAMGVLQYSITTAPRLWDVAAGVVLVEEAGGLVMRPHRTQKFGGLMERTRWEPAESLVPSWQSGHTTLKDLRRWSAPLVLGSPDVVRHVTSNLRRRTSLQRSLRRAVRRAWRGGHGRSGHRS